MYYDSEIAYFNFLIEDINRLMAAGKFVDLSEACLQGADLLGANLSGALVAAHNKMEAGYVN